MGISNKFDGKLAKVRYSTENAMFNPNSLLHCDKCHKKLGLLHMLRRSILVKKGYEYIVICKYCNKTNIRVKGEIGKQFDSDWDKYGF